MSYKETKQGTATLSNKAFIDFEQDYEGADYHVYDYKVDSAGNYAFDLTTANNLSITTTTSIPNVTINNNVTSGKIELRKNHLVKFF